MLRIHRAILGLFASAVRAAASFSSKGRIRLLRRRKMGFWRGFVEVGEERFKEEGGGGGGVDMDVEGSHGCQGLRD